MKRKSVKSSKRNILTRIGVDLIAVVAVLMVPLIAKAPWTQGDFIFAGIVLCSSVISYEFITRNMNDKMHRLAIALGIVLIIGVIIAWAATGPSNEAAQLLK